MLKSTLAALSIVGLLASSSAFAAAAPKTPVAPAAAPAADDAKKMKSKECSLMADKKGLHGKARKAFRETCKKAA